MSTTHKVGGGRLPGGGEPLPQTPKIFSLRSKIQRQNSRMHKSKIHSQDADSDSARACYQTFRVTPAEAAELVSHARAAGVSISHLVRSRALGQRAPVAAAPALNREVYVELARTAANLNQLTHHLNQVQVAGQAQVIDLAAVRALIQKALDELAGLRADLIGAGNK